MSWRGRDNGRTRWGDDNREREPRDYQHHNQNRWRGRSPVWEPRHSSRDRRDDRRRDSYDARRDRSENFRDRIDNFRDRGENMRDRGEYVRDRSENVRERVDNAREREIRDRERERDRRRERATRLEAEISIPNPPSPPKISVLNKSRSKSRSTERSVEMEDYNDYERDAIEGGFDENETNTTETEREENPTAVNLSPGDWFCKCGSYNFKRRQVCYRRNCFGKRSEGTIYGDNDRSMPESGITKRLLFRRLDALTTEENILEAIKGRCTKAVLDSIAGITIGRETLTGASKCLAYINFNSIADSTAAHTELLSLSPQLKIDGREVLISYYNEPQKTAKADYSSYYNQMSYQPTNMMSQQNLSEADRVNQAAAVAQSAITAAQARNYCWTPTTAPTFATSTKQAAKNIKLPTGDGKTVYTAPDVRTFLYDETSGYYYDPATGLYYDGTTQYFFNNQTSQYMYWDATTCTYIAATQTQQNTEQPKLPNPPQATVENTIMKEPEEKKKKKEDQVKVAKKIAKDMERWARTLNQKKENARSNIVMEQHYDNSASKGSADIGFSVLGAGPTLTHSAPIVRELSPPPLTVTEEFLVKKSEVDTFDSDDGIIDWGKLTCLLCKRKFPSPDVLNKHKSMSDLHKQNLAEYRKSEDLNPQPNGYRDRAAERRMKFGEDEPIVNKRYVPEPVLVAPTLSAPPPNVADTIGGKMLQKMGWSEGRGLGKTEQGRTAPIEAEQRPALVGLGQKKGIYTPTPGETYRDTVKKLMIARYREVVGED